MQEADIVAAIRAAVEAQGGKRHAIERTHGLPQDAIRGIERGHEPGAFKLLNVCRALGLEFYVGKPRRPPIAETSPARPSLLESECSGTVGAYVTRLTDGLETRGARFSALGCAWFGAGVLTDLELDPELCRAVEVLDDSMAPLFPRASVALTDLRRTEPRDGGIFLLGPETRPTLRRLVRDERSWRVETEAPGWESRPLAVADEILGEARWRSMALPPAAPVAKRPRRRGPAVKVTAMETENLRPWAVPWRGALTPDAPLEAGTELVSWFEVGFLRALGIDPLNAEVVKVTDHRMAPLLWPGAVVLVDRRRTARRDGAIVELMSERGAVLRRCVRRGRRWRVASGPHRAERPFRATDYVIGEAVWSAAFLAGEHGPET